MNESQRENTGSEQTDGCSKDMKENRKLVVTESDIDNTHRGQYKHIRLQVNLSYRESDQIKEFKEQINEEKDYSHDCRCCR